MINALYAVLFNFTLAGIASLGFAIIFNAPRKELLFCALCGAYGWVVYHLSSNIWADAVTATFLGALTAATFSRIFSYTRRAPSTLFLIPGIIPLVPGSQMYNTMTAILNNNMYFSYQEATLAFKLAGVIALGIIVIFALPQKLFTLAQSK